MSKKNFLMGRKKIPKETPNISPLTINKYDKEKAKKNFE